MRGRALSGGCPVKLCVKIFGTLRAVFMVVEKAARARSPIERPLNSGGQAGVIIIDMFITTIATNIILMFS